MYGQFFVIFALILTGYFCRKVKIISEEMNRGLSKFIIYISFPCFIFYKVAGIDMHGGFLREFLLAFALSAALFLISGLYAYLYARLRRFPREDSGSAEVMMVMPNNAFMGFPIASIFFGDTGLLFMLANNIAMNLAMFTYGVFALHRGDGKKGISIKSSVKSVFNPNILALIFGLLFCWFAIPLPSWAGSYFTYIGNLCTPLAMIFIGAMLVGTDIKKAARDRVVLESVINKDVAMPVLAYAFLALMPVPAMIKAIVIFGSCFPSAAIASVLVGNEGKNSGLAGIILVASTAVSIVTIPVSVKLINLLVL